MTMFIFLVNKHVLNWKGILHCVENQMEDQMKQQEKF